MTRRNNPGDCPDSRAAGNRPKVDRGPSPSQTPKRRWPAWAAFAALAFAVLAAWPHATPDVRGDVHEGTTQREAFLSGGARSEIVLREVSETLKRIDGRLERFERALREAEQRPADREAPLQDAGPQPGADQPLAGPENQDNR